MLSLPIFSLFLILSHQGIKLGYINLEIIKKVFNINNFITMFTYPFVVTASVFYFFIETIASKINIKNIKGELSQLDYLNEILEKEKNEFNKLKKYRISLKENQTTELEKINDNQVLKTLNDSLDICYDLGYNENKYYKYWIEGTLDNKLNDYTKEELIFIKNYLKEKHKVLKKSLKTM